ncbi:TMEM175 family protein [soil metagenome]
MQTDRGLDRLAFFTDAIAAIAITLLILPLVDLVPGFTGTPEHFLQRHLTELGSFVLSFAVIARLWMAHHTLFEHVGSYSRTLRWLSLAWAFTIVLLPLPTAMVARWQPEALIVGFYIGTMLLSSCLLTAMSVLVSRTPRLQQDGNPPTRDRVLSSVLSSAEFLVALVIGTLFRDINFFALLLLFVSTPILALVRKRSSKVIAHA